VLDSSLLFATQASEELPAFMNGPVKHMLGIIPPEFTWQTCKLSIVVFVFVQNTDNVIDKARCTDNDRCRLAVTGAAVLASANLCP